MATTMGLMLWACLTSDWEKLSILAQESAEIIDDDDDDDEAEGGANSNGLGNIYQSP